MVMNAVSALKVHFTPIKSRKKNHKFDTKKFEYGRGGLFYIEEDEEWIAQVKIKILISNSLYLPQATLLHFVYIVFILFFK